MTTWLQQLQHNFYDQKVSLIYNTKKKMWCKLQLKMCFKIAVIQPQLFDNIVVDQIVQKNVLLFEVSIILIGESITVLLTFTEKVFALKQCENILEKTNDKSKLNYLKMLDYKICKLRI
jgi:hypothetical protein